MRDGTATDVLDTFLPRPDFVERHSILIQAPPQKVWDAVHAFDLSGSRVTKALFAGRGAIARLRHGRAQSDLPTGLNSQTPLADMPPHLVVRGLAGRWWTFGGDNVTLNDADEFLAFTTPGYAKATFSFELVETDDGGTRLVTETRVLATDAAARRVMGRYWLLIRPFSGAIRRIMLRRVRTLATAT
ncbi:hypothetical protein [Spirillospora sp. CA-294931]|uniref:hypothetical protein n=1 Tax=Spirillospora sp. CA-294931 TaxID=3240042 RepID=UPI003D925913